MTNSVTLNGNTYDDSNSGPNRYLGNGGHRTNLIPMLSDAVADLAAKQAAAAGSASAASTKAGEAAASAQSAINAPGTSATSTTSLTVGTGSKTLTIQTGKSLVVGMSVKIASTTTPTNWMFGDITAFDSGTGSLSVNVTSTNGSGTTSAWTVSLSGPSGVAGTAGASALTTYSARTANVMLVAADKGKLIDITSGTFTQTFDACATLGNGWSVWIRNAGTGDITLDPSASELIDGVTSGVIKPGMMLLIQCDGVALNIARVDATPIMEVKSSGTSWTCPLGVRRAKLRMVGGGAGGVNSGNATYPNHGGGGGGYLEKILTLTPGSAYTYAVGAGGAGSNTQTGNAGGNSTFTVAATTYQANGAPAMATAYDASIGGTASNGDLNVKGGDAHYFGNGQYGMNGTTPLGSISVQNGAAGQGYGSGGRNGANTIGGAGAPGVVILEY